MQQKILVVEDDALSAEFVRIFLQDKGYQVAVSTSTREALSSFSTFEPCIVVTDIQLGDGNGGELARKFKLLANTKIIAVSGHSRDQLNQLHTDMSNFDYILEKPIDLGQLSNVIEQLLES